MVWFNYITWNILWVFCSLVVYIFITASFFLYIFMCLSDRNFFLIFLVSINEWFLCVSVCGVCNLSAIEIYSQKASFFHSTKWKAVADARKSFSINVLLPFIYFYLHLSLQRSKDFTSFLLSSLFSVKIYN